MAWLGGEGVMTMDDLKTRVLAAVAAEPSPSRSEARRRHFLLLVAAVSISVVVFLAMGGVRPYARPVALWIGTSAGALLVAAAAVAVAVRRGPSMLGRPAALLVGVALATPLLLLLWKIGLSERFPGMMEPWVTKRGFRCLGLALGVGAAPIA